MKTKKELESLRSEMAQLKKKLVELTDDELAVVTGGLSAPPGISDLPLNKTYNIG